MSNPVDRYRKLRYEEGLANIHRYPIACKELSTILREAYSDLPKNLHSILFYDILTAFRLLPEMQTQSAVSAAHLLYQSAEAKLPKQKKILAVSEFKRAKVAHKRRSKAFRKEEIIAELPEDVLTHTFSFLDTQSLASMGNVCQSWNVAASNNLLWQAHYAKIFGSDTDSKGQKMTSDSGSSIDWKEAFKTTYFASNPDRLASNRGYCHSCKAVVWLAGMECCNEANCSTRKQLKNTGVIHITSRQVVEYLLHGSSALSLSSKDTDSDSEDLTMWAYDFSSY